MSCPLCNLSSREPILYEDDIVYLVSTKNLKGHKVRVMVATKRHTNKPSFQEQITADAVLIDYMTNLMCGQDWFIVSNQYASISDHWHRIACDVPTEGELDPLFEQTQKINFPIKENKVLIGIPAYNEEKTLSSVITECKQYGDVLIVNDGSTDTTEKIASGNFVITHNKNLGYGASIQDIFRFAKQNNYDILITLDADGQHNPTEIPKFLKELKTSDIIVGNRFISKNTTSSYRKLGIKTISKLSGIEDSQCGFRAYNKKAIVTIVNNIYEQGMGVSVEILKVAQKFNLKINETSCTIKYGKDDHSQNSLSHGFDVLRALFWTIIWDKPTKTLLPTGFLLLILTVITGTQTINLYVQFHTIVLSWALLTISSIICTMLIFNTLTFIYIFKNQKVNRNEI